MTINITQKHIDVALGRIYEKPMHTDCPVALALRQVGFSSVSVGAGGFCVLDGEVFQLSREAGERVDRYTRTLYMEPFSFELPDTLLDA